MGFLHSQVAPYEWALGAVMWVLGDTGDNQILTDIPDLCSFAL
jgi:hypothetical protein